MSAYGPQGARQAAATAAMLAAGAAYGLWQTPKRHLHDPTGVQRGVIGGADFGMGLLSGAAVAAADGVSKNPLANAAVKWGLRVAAAALKEKALQATARVLDPQKAQIADNANKAYSAHLWTLLPSNPAEAARQAILSNVFGYDTDLRAQMRNNEAAKFQGGPVNKFASVGYADALVGMGVKLSSPASDAYAKMIKSMPKEQLLDRQKLMLARKATAEAARKGGKAEGLTAKAMPSAKGVALQQQKADRFGAAAAKLKPGYRGDGSHTVMQGARELGDFAKTKFHGLSDSAKNNAYLAGGAGLLGAGALGYGALSNAAAGLRDPNQGY